MATILQTGTSGLGSFIAEDFPFTTGSTGRLDVSVDWTFASSAIAVYLARGSCSIDQLNARSCDFLIRSEASMTPKPRRQSVNNVAAGSFVLIIGNAGTQDEAVTLQVVLASATCPAFTVAEPGVSRTSAAPPSYRRFRLR